ncbi:MAG: 5-(carboxyamino)imidazole ribonucleotide synthase [Bacteroidetes bacterium]|nr:MAG: 5-(carboxyamino)imidazole ribonucleotide synthase [Bacteroidota bacterium]MBL1144995.1 5-(carboxyamino)imidazole ribonucleotide synthase [Bacteroidota bacterium]MCB0802108.1 5-(carboxyamino)imidazole ribonucleotide synthase [Flavobacteriales bacterium]NOG57791.1 5-(carboxyamino)imidazole ribonucleotide synthase [Bacteroidota bacterium]
MSNIHSSNFKIGMLGGGQLGRMTLQEAYNLNLHIDVLDPSENAPCKTLANQFVVGDFKDYQTVLNFGKDKNVLTIEFEDVNSDALADLEKMGVKVFPQSRVLKIIQDKGLQKEFYKQHQIPSSPFELINNLSEIKNSKLDFPIFQKLRTSGYDGYGVQKLNSKNELDKAFDKPSVLESAVNLNKELSVIVARNEQGECKHFPLVELEFNPTANMVEFLFSPANVSAEIESQAYELAHKVIEKLDMVGILAVEMFLDQSGNLMVNEIAPRAHNSGHQSIEGNYTSQFGQHLRSILSLPLGDTNIILPSVMVNLLGEKGANGEAVYEGMDEILKIPGVYPHLYGKEMVKPFRKMGHITIVHKEMAEAKKIAQKVKQIIKAKAK